MPRLEPKFCHHCHTKKECAVCDSGDGCAKSYCGTCIEKYGTTLADVMREDPWKCFGCRGECLCTGCRKRGRSTAEPVVPSIHPKFIAWFAAAGIPADSDLLKYTSGGGPPPELPSVVESQRLAERGLPEPICPNVWAKPFVPARLNLASSAYRGVSSQGNRFRARICVDKVEYTICDAETEEAAARAYDLESLRFGKVRFLNFVYKGINDTLLPPGLEDALRKAGRVLPLSSTPALPPLLAGAGGSSSNGLGLGMGMGMGAGAGSGSSPGGRRGSAAAAASSKGAKKGKAASSSGAASKRGRSSPEDSAASGPVGFQAMGRGMAAQLSQGLVPTVKATTATQTGLRPAQLPGLLRPLPVTDDDIISDQGGGSGADVLSPPGSLGMGMGLGLMGSALHDGSGLVGHSYPLSALLPTSSGQWKSQGDGPSSKRQRGTNNSNGLASTDVDGGDGGFRAGGEEAGASGPAALPTTDMSRGRGWPSAASLLGLGLGLGAIDPSPQAAGLPHSTAAALAPMGPASHVQLGIIDHSSAGVGVGNGYDGAGAGAGAGVYGSGNGYGDAGNTNSTGGPALIAPAAVFAALAGSNWAAEGEAYGRASAGQSTSQDASAGRSDTHSTGHDTAWQARQQKLERLLSFIASPEAKLVLSKGQIRKFKQMVVTGGRTVLALLGGAADAFDRALLTAGIMREQMLELTSALEAARAGTSSSATGAGAGAMATAQGGPAVSVPGASSLRSPVAAGSSMGSTGAAAVVDVKDIDGGLNVTLADDVPAGQGAGAAGDPASSSASAADAPPSADLLQVVLPPVLISAGNELIDTLGSCYNLWSQVGELYGLLKLRPTGTGGSTGQPAGAGSEANGAGAAMDGYPAGLGLGLPQAASVAGPGLAGLGSALGLAGGPALSEAGASLSLAGLGLPAGLGLGLPMSSSSEATA